jgi:hypothetical protein
MSNFDSAFSQRLTAGCLQKNGFSTLTKNRSLHSLSKTYVYKRERKIPEIKLHAAWVFEVKLSETFFCER